jgi:hypothetical protein
MVNGEFASGNRFATDWFIGSMKSKAEALDVLPKLNSYLAPSIIAEKN